MPTTVSIHALGSLELLDHEGRPVNGAAAQPKRIALLAYLAIARPRGFHRRDTLLALFWPELETRRARAALNKAVHHLRASLGADAILSRGSEEIAVDRERVWCDVVAFDDALDAGRPEDALALYRGDLLQGFHMSGAADFEHWLDVERDRLRWRAREAAWGLVDEAEAAGDVANAIRWARTAHLFDPDDESSLRRWIELLHRTGNDAAALREFETFARRLRDLYGIDPSPVTYELVASLGSRGHGVESDDSAGGPDGHTLQAPSSGNGHGSVGLEAGWTFRSVIEGMADAVAVVDGAGTVHYISEAVRNMLGYAPAEMIGRPIWEFVHEDDIAFLESRLASRLRGEGDPERYTEIRLWHREGHLRVLQLHGRLYQDRSRTPMVIVAARDITAQRGPWDFRVAPGGVDM